SWPANEIELYGPGTDSGTFDYFVEEVLGEGDSRSDYTASEDDNILVVGVQNDVDALGYFGLAYYAENSATLRAAAIDGGDGPVLPTDETVNNGTYTPFSRPLFIYVRKDALEADEALVSFVNYYIQNAPTIVPEVGYVALPEEIYGIASRLVANVEAGTVFQNEDIAGRDLVDILDMSRTLEAPAE
ncbi:MAG: substrate-binding domain-containing protein, partial [Leptolyngbyaceae bacterium]|nr:substrate-binding domain-containing protein [Leptolyngbyaceae bacterium]